MPRVLIAEAQQEISTFNHVFCDYDFFTKMWAVRLKRWSMHRSRESEIRPAWLPSVIYTATWEGVTMQQSTLAGHLPQHAKGVFLLPRGDELLGNR